MINRKLIRGWIRIFIPLFVFISIWELCSFLVGEDRFPEIFKLANALWMSLINNKVISAQTHGAERNILPHIEATIKCYLIGFLIGIVSGIIIGISTFRSRIKLFSEKMIEILRVIPPLVIIPFILFLVQPAENAVIMAVAIYSAYSIYIYTYSALAIIDQNYDNIATVYGAKPLQRILHVYLPSISKELIGGLRVTNAWGIGIIFLAEYLGSPRGLGRVLQYAMSFNNVELIIVSVLWAVIIALIVDIIISLFSHFYLKWIRRGRKEVIEL